jgi:hypothetical protein
MSDDRTIANSSEQNQKVSNNTELWRALENEHYSNIIEQYSNRDTQHAAATCTGACPPPRERGRRDQQKHVQQKKDPVGPARVPTGSSGNEGVECPRRRTAVAVDRSISRIAGSAVRCQLLSLVVKARSRDGQGHQTPVANESLSNRPANHQSAFGDVAVFRVGGEFLRRWTSP